jgi:hypothetical protein
MPDLKGRRPHIASWVIVAVALIVAGTAIGITVLATGGNQSASTTSTTRPPPATTSTTSTTLAAPPSTPPTTSAPPTTTPAVPTSQQLPISVQPTISGSGADSSILLPSSCTLSGNIVTATGTFNGGFVPEVYNRVGAVVELYVYSGLGAQGNQIADLNNQQTYRMVGNGPWTVTTPLLSGIGSPESCQVAAQATHNFVGAPGN